jgi:hypothetical protein
MPSVITSIAKEVNAMETYQALMPLSFFRSLLPYNAELLSGNALLLRACGAKPDDGSVLRSREFLLFGNGLATIIPYADVLEERGEDGYVVSVTRKSDARHVTFWEIQSVARPEGRPAWSLATSRRPPGDRNVIRLIQSEGQPGQYFYLRA